MSNVLICFHENRPKSQKWYSLRTPAKTLARRRSDRSMNTSLRYGTKFKRACEDYQKWAGPKDPGRKPSFVSFFDTGYQTTVHGEGPMYKSILKRRKLGKHSGSGHQLSRKANSKFRIKTFHRSFTYTRKDVDSHK